MSLDHALELDHLAQADGHIAMAERHVAHQQMLIEQLRAAGQDAHDAERLLGTMERTLEVYRNHRRIIMEVIQRMDRYTL